jgi:hypothetical protein
VRTVKVNMKRLELSELLIREEDIKAHDNHRNQVHKEASPAALDDLVGRYSVDPFHG